MYTKELGLQMSGQNRRICGIGTIEMKKKKNIHIFDTITNPIKIIAKRKEVISNIKKKPSYHMEYFQSQVLNLQWDHTLHVN